MAETVATKPAFRDAFARGQRCIVPVDGFYEWKKLSTGKQPYAIVGADGLPLALAGLWERWNDRTTGETREAHDDVLRVVAVHLEEGRFVSDRMHEIEHVVRLRG